MKRLLITILALALLLSASGQILRYSNYTAPTPPVEDTLTYKGVIGDGNTEGWYVADDDYVTIVTGVSQWDDISGNDRHLLQSTGAYQPLWTNADNKVRFNNNTKVMTSVYNGGGDIAQPVFVYIVTNIVGLDGYDNIISLRSADMSIRVSGTGTLQMISGGNYSTGGTNLVPLINVPIIIRGLFNGASSKIQVNEVASSSADAGTTAITTIQVGGAGLMNENVYEIIIRTHADSDEEQMLIVDYLNAKYTIY